MNHKIDTILNDLYRIDPSFRSHEKELRKLVSELVTSTPDTKFDGAFAARLRAELMQKFPQVSPILKTARRIPSPYFSRFSFSSSYVFSHVRSWAPTALILLLLPFSYVGIRHLASNPSTGFEVQQQISDKGAQAFGTIAVPTTVKNTRVAFLPELAPTPAMVAPVNVVTSAPAAGKVTAMSAMNMQSTKISMTREPQPETSISYTYAGAPLTALNSSGKVYKRITDGETTDDLSHIIQTSNFSVLSLTSFTNLKPRTMELAEDAPLGYVLNIDFNQGLININPDWPKWDSIDNASGEFVIPDDATLIAISNKFLKDHNINMSLYKAPIVIRDVSTAAGAKVSAANTVTVTYPIMIDNMAVYDESGQPYGLQVAVNVSAQKVASVTNLTSQKYESASYDLISDAATVLSEATSSAPAGAPVTSKTIKANLQTPEHVLTKIWKAGTEGSVGTELYIPALLFKATNETASSTILQPVIVPITKQSF